VFQPVAVGVNAIAPVFRCLDPNPKKVLFAVPGSPVLREIEQALRVLVISPLPLGDD
jgi:hypothetical protein